MFKTIAETRAFFSAFTPLVAKLQALRHHRRHRLHRHLHRRRISERHHQYRHLGQNVSWSKKALSPAKFPRQCLPKPACRYVIIGHSERRQRFRERTTT